ncbi:DNA (cytosine-5-)-methyltransferase [Geovibrio ferrireducens]|uniref:DNA (cytosine-5-)-methyltransferase n=1 Tax=Geovibrio ferrireducens TaxID=46201 RepID=UPI002247F48E|nr:DNA (cytosine-5-)-methyltransferase [Geovibrio ferrireducens]
MKYATVCSGIEAPSVAWAGLGWEPSWFSEIDPFCCAVLEHYYPHVPNLGDMTKIIEKVKNGEAVNNIGLLAGGTPCQDFSVAGKQSGMDGDRGQLTMEYVNILERIKPPWLLWENVPGVLSTNGGRDFGKFIGALVECGYGIAYRVLDAQFFGVPQRRRRVFVVGYLGDWRPAAAVLFEPQSMFGDSPKGGEKRAGVAAFTESRFAEYIEGYGGLRASGVSCGQGSETLIVTQNASHWDDPDNPHPTLLSSSGEHYIGSSNQEIFSQRGGGLVQHCIPLNMQVVTRHEALGEGTGFGVGDEGDPAYTIGATHHHAVCYDNHPQDSRLKEFGDISPTITQKWGSGGCNTALVRRGGIVRRITPLEAERLQGFPDYYTRIPRRILKHCPASRHFEKYPDMYSENPDGSFTRFYEDGPRYSALGNTIAIPPLRWLGERIDFVDTVLLKKNTLLAYFSID